MGPSVKFVSPISGLISGKIFLNHSATQICSFRRKKKWWKSQFLAKVGNQLFWISCQNVCRQDSHTYVAKSFGQTKKCIWTNTFCNWEKYILQLGEIQFAIGKNTFCNWDKYILQVGQIQFVIGRNTFCNWKNTFCNWKKYILQLGQIHQDCVSEMGCTLLRKHSRHH